MNESTVERTWVVTDGRTGILNQALGLAEAIGLPIDVKTVHPRAPWTWLPVTMWLSPLASLSADSASFAPPWPRLAIGCGWRSIPFVREVKRLSNGGTTTIQLQDPRIAPSYFDLVVPPEHDGLTGPNVLPMIGSPNRITRAKLDEAANAWRARFAHLKPPRVAVLVGGKSKSHRFDEPDAETLAAQLKALCDQGASLLVTTSRRTGEAQRKIIKRALPPEQAFVWDGSGENPYFAMLGLCDAVVVTSDSTNMITEAAATGKPVHVVALPGGNPKFDRLLAKLGAQGITRPFQGRIESWSYMPLAETARIAAEIRQRLGLSPAAH